MAACDTQLQSYTHYNDTKFVLLYKPSTSSSNYKAINRSFILTHTSTKLVGQYISSNWFNWKYNVSEDISFMIIGINKNMSFIKLQNLLDKNNFDSFDYMNSFTIKKEILQEIYDNQRPRDNINCISLKKDMILSFTTRLYKNNDDDSNKIMISHPLFKLLV